MNVAIHVFNRVIDDGVVVVRIQSVIRFQFAAIDGYTRFDVLSNLPLQSSLAPIIYDEGANVSATLHHAHHNGLVFSASASDDAGTLATMHVAGLASDEGFIYLNLTTRSA